MELLSRLTIRTKIVLVYTAALVLLVLVWFVSWRSINEQSATFQDIGNNNLQGAIQLANAQSAMWQLRYGVSQFLNVDDVNRRRIAAESDKWYRQINTNLTGYESGFRTPEELHALGVWKSAYMLYAQARPRWFELQFAGKTEEAAAWRARTIFPYGQDAVDALDQLIELQRHVSSQKQQEAADAATRANTTLIGMTSTGFFVILGLAFLLARSIIRPVSQLTTSALAVTNGDLSVTVPVRTHDEIGILGTAFNQMTATIRQQTQQLEAQVTLAENARAEAEAARVKIATQLATIEAQQTVIREMSVPILPLTATALVLPLVGALDDARLHVIQQHLFHHIATHAARHVVLDVTGVPIIDREVAQDLMRVVQGVRLLGAEVLLTGIRPEVAQSIVGLGINLDSVITRSTLQNGIAYVLQRV